MQQPRRSAMRCERLKPVREQLAPARHAAFEKPLKARLHARFHNRPHPKNPANFATDSIAAKPVKPCDGGVSGPLNSLSKKE